MNATQCLSHALAYAAMGCPVLPLAPGEKRPATELVPSGFRNATTDAQTIRRWFAAQPRAGVGIVPGPAGLLALDVDDKHGKCGSAALQALEDAHGALPATLVQRTPSGSRHLMLRVPPDVAARIGNTDLAPGIDVRCSAGYVAAEPTRLADGGCYSFDDWDAASGEVPEIADAPAWLIDKLTQATAKPAAPAAAPGAPAADPFDAATPQLVAELRSALNALDPGDYASWVDCGHRLKSLGEAGRELWLSWSQQSAKWQPADAQRWEGFAAERTGYRAIFAAAQARGWINPASKAARIAPGSMPPPAADRAAAIQRARELLAPKLAEREAPAYPVEALGPLAEACAAVAEHGQVRPAMAGQTLLGAASLLTQGLFNVETLAGARPLSLYLLTLGDSGDGKSTAQGVALQSVHDWQREAGEAHRDALADYEQAKAKRKKGDTLPEAPASPYRLMGDATVEGLRRDLDIGPCAQGVFTDEAAAMLSGYGMSAEHRSKSASVFSGLWDNGHLSVSRAIGGRVERYGRRVAMHWLIQPIAAAEAVGDPLLVGLGFWPRFLAAWPEPLPPRLAIPFKPHALPALARYWQRCAELLAQPLPDEATKAPRLPLADDAHALLRAAFERLEVQGRRGALLPVKPYALRGAEQACRVAGVLSAFAGRAAIDAEAMRGALALVMHSLDTWMSLADEGAADQSAGYALRLYEWLTTRPGWCERLAVIVKDGPACVRSRDKRDAALSLLREFGLVEVGDGAALALALEGSP